MTVLTIRLASPMQSYGVQASFDRRPSDFHPTKSAVLGMVAAALGYRREDERIEQLNHLSFAVRVDQVGSILTDFQTVEYDPDKHQKKLTYRDYLQDFVYVVALSSDDDQLIEQIKAALAHPKFQLYLGRRSNPPAGPLKMRSFEDSSVIEILTKRLPWQASSWFQNRVRGKYTADLFADAALLPDAHSVMTKDLVGSFNQKSRYYHYREVAHMRVQLSGDDHDIMSSL